MLRKGSAGQDNPGRPQFRQTPNPAIQLFRTLRNPVRFFSEKQRGLGEVGCDHVRSGNQGPHRWDIVLGKEPVAPAVVAQDRIDQHQSARRPHRFGDLLKERKLLAVADQADGYGTPAKVERLEMVPGLLQKLGLRLEDEPGVSPVCREQGRGQAAGLETRRFEDGNRRGEGNPAPGG
jgi:hypothetical protein